VDVFTSFKILNFGAAYGDTFFASFYILIGLICSADGFGSA